MAPRADGLCRNGKSFHFERLCYFSLKRSLPFFFLLMIIRVNLHTAKQIYINRIAYFLRAPFSEDPPSVTTLILLVGEKSKPYLRIFNMASGSQEKDI
jgi:hypothetical protein